jgi:hypothetical protein
MLELVTRIENRDDERVESSFGSCDGGTIRSRRHPMEVVDSEAAAEAAHTETNSNLNGIHPHVVKDWNHVASKSCSSWR